MSAETSCNICGKASILKCSGCFEVYYCSKDHQKVDWKNHKPNCTSFKIATDDKLGRHLIASRYIGEGEIIINEEPIITGPSQITPPICLGCYNPLNQFNKRNCSKCGWPVCSEACENSNLHISECEITSQCKKKKVNINIVDANLPHPSYQCLTVLRCLHLKKLKPHLWKKLMNLESHCEKRKSTFKYNSDTQFIANFIRDFFNYVDFSKEEILEVVGIVQVNAHEIPLKELGYIAIFEKASFLEHSCTANCMKSFTNYGNLVIRAAKKIAPGDHLSICYTDPLWGRITRLKHLLDTKFFLCRCIRCTDPTEFGTHFNSMRCRNCQGYTFPIVNELILKDDEDTEQSWKCQKCKNITKDENNILANVDDVYCNIDKQNEKSLEVFIHNFKNILHPNHYVLVSAKLALLDIFTSQDKILNLPKNNLDWTIEMCKELYELATKLVPAENRLRGVLLYQLHFALMEKNRRQKIQEFDTKSSWAQDNFKELKNILKQSYKFLSYEPDELPEGKMALELKYLIKTMEDQKINFEEVSFNKNTQYSHSNRKNNTTSENTQTVLM